MSWDFSVIWRYWPALAWAFAVTLRVSILSITVGLVGGLVLGLLGLARMAWLGAVVRAMTSLLLSLPPLVLIVWIYFCLPALHPLLRLSGEQAAVAGLGLSLSPFVAEIVRAGANSVPFGQMEAAFCSGLSRTQAVRYILLPQALRRMWPPLLGQFITCYKFSTLASIVAVEELLHQGGMLIAQTYRPLEVYTAIAAIFVATIVPLNALARRLEGTARYGGTTAL